MRENNFINSILHSCIVSFIICNFILSVILCWKEKRLVFQNTKYLAILFYYIFCFVFTFLLFFSRLYFYDCEYMCVYVLDHDFRKCCNNGWDNFYTLYLE